MLLWTGLIFFLGWDQSKTNRDLIFSLAEVEARASFNKDLVYRRWASGYGGVYVPPSEEYPPNPYLSLSMVISPPISRTRRFTMPRPKPVPECFLV